MTENSGLLPTTAATTTATDYAIKVGTATLAELEKMITYPQGYSAHETRLAAYAVTAHLFRLPIKHLHSDASFEDIIPDDAVPLARLTALTFGAFAAANRIDTEERIEDQAALLNSQCSTTATEWDVSRNLADYCLTRFANTLDYICGLMQEYDLQGDDADDAVDFAVSAPTRWAEFLKSVPGAIL